MSTAERRTYRLQQPHERKFAQQLQARPPNAGELAWLVLQVFACAEQARENGWCLGALRPANLAETGREMRRASRESAISVVLSKLRARSHRKEGHDPWCYEFGISRAHLWRLIRELRPQDGGWLVLEAVEAAWGDVQLGARTANESARDCVEYRVRERITPMPWSCTTELHHAISRASARADMSSKTRDAAHPTSGARHRWGAERDPQS